MECPWTGGNGKRVECFIFQVNGVRLRASCFAELHSVGFHAFKRVMGLFRRIMGALFNGPPSKPEEIVFEPIDGPLDVPSTLPPSAQQPFLSKRGILQRVALAELMPRVPSQWKRAGDWTPERLVELPVEARLDVGAERPLAFSLRYLVRQYPEHFRDPGATERDVGFDLSLEPFREPPPLQADIPLESFAEAEQERGTFSDWEEELRASKLTTAEARETMKALRGVRLPPSEGANPAAFEAVLEQKNIADSQPLSSRATPKKATPATGSNSRLRKILEAYAESVPEAERAPASEAARVAVEVPAKRQVLEAPARSFVPGTETASDWARMDVASSAEARAAHGKMGLASQMQGEARVALPQTRFEELGLSLSRFPEVRGFALWLEQDALQTGELGFDARGSLMRARLEKMLENGFLGQRGQDGFLSVTVHQATGGISIFGGGSCLVAVAHQTEGMPAHLRAWLCGWVSQPLRG